MFKKIISLLSALALLLCLPFPAFADSEVMYVIDNAGLMTTTELSALSSEARSLQETYHVDIALLTVDTLGGARPQDYANDYYDTHGYSEDGLLFLLSMEEREWYVSTSGSMVCTLTDYGIQQTANAALPYFSEERYYDGFNAFLCALSAYLEAEKSGSPIDGYAEADGSYYHGDRETVVYHSPRRSPNLVLSVIIGLSAAVISVFVMASAMNTKHRQTGAASYMKPGSFYLHTHQDIFLYSNVSKAARPKDTGSGSGHNGGGSSVHHSSSGRSHGGGGGKF